MAHAGKGKQNKYARTRTPTHPRKHTHTPYHTHTQLYIHPHTLPLPTQLNTVDLLSGGRAALEQANKEWGLALADDEIAYLVDAYTNVLKRNPTDVELLMFAQVCVWCVSVASVFGTSL